MPLNRQFIGWDQPALPAICRQLLELAADGDTADLTNFLVVVPSGRARYRILELLIEFCEQQNLVLVPPQTVTVGELPEHLYRQKKPFANELTQRMAWVRAIQGLDTERLQSVFHTVPTENNHPAWTQMADLLGRMHRELASDVLMFSDVEKHASKVDGFAEHDRWQVLTEIQLSYLSTLDECELWDRQTARSFAIQHNECRTDKRIFLVAAADINQSLRQMLAQATNHAANETDTQNSITTFVFTDQSHSDRFDEYGCLIPEKWIEAEIEMSDSQIVVADRPEQQARAVAGEIEKLESRYRSDEIVIALPQPDLEPFVERTLSRHNLKTRFVRGTSLAESPVLRLLETVAAFLNTQRFEQFASLVRHPAIHAAVLADVHVESFLTELDKYQNTYFPTSITDLLQQSEDEIDLDDISERSDKNLPDEVIVRRVTACLRRIISPLIGETRPLSDWREAIQQFLESMYGQRVFDRNVPQDKIDLQAFQRVIDTFNEFSQVPKSLMPVVSCTAAIRALMQHLRSEYVMPVPDPDAIQVIGWLDLPLEDSPVAIITGFNDGVIPSAESADLFLPNTLRENLNLLNNSRRYARDAYALTAVLKSRGDVALIAGRRDAQKNPLSPSRLMFATDEMNIAQRAHSFFSHEVEDEAGIDLAELVDQQNGSSSIEQIDFGFHVPKPIPGLVKVTQLSPTAFQNYLKCPYRFYLQRVLRSSNRMLEDREQEMNAGDFGTVIHDVLERFGNSEWKDSNDVGTIRKCFTKYVDDFEASRFQFPIKPAVILQIENMRMRLDRFAEKQAEWRNQGWRIEYCETDELIHMLDVDGEPFRITGRIDRIDIHEETGEMFVFDYKTSTAGKTPEKAHVEGRRWVNLQLPMYRHLVKSLPQGDQCRLGYIVLPPTLNDIDFAPAKWTEEQLLEADEVARDVIRDLRNGVFWPPKDPPPKFSEEFADICMDNIFDRPAFSEVDDVTQIAAELKSLSALAESATSSPIEKPCR